LAIKIHIEAKEPHAFGSKIPHNVTKETHIFVNKYPQNEAKETLYLAVKIHRM